MSWWPPCWAQLRKSTQLSKEIQRPSDTPKLGKIASVRLIERVRSKTIRPTGRCRTMIIRIIAREAHHLFLKTNESLVRKGRQFPSKMRPWKISSTSKPFKLVKFLSIRKKLIKVKTRSNKWIFKMREGISETQVLLMSELILRINLMNLCSTILTCWERRSRPRWH